jgi:transaldolase/glucose-6-phosphate isomerase
VKNAQRYAHRDPFLHSTGQLHKGGPNTGVFLQVTCDDAEDLSIPGRKYTFGMLKRAQALGDYEVLTQRGRRIVRVHVGPDVEPGLTICAASSRTHCRKRHLDMP